MRVRLHNLPPTLDAGLRQQLPAAGHELVEGSPADAIVAGTGVPVATAPTVELDTAAWTRTLAAIRTAFLSARDVAAELRAADRPGRIIFVADPSTVRVLDGGALSSVAGAFLTTLAQVAAVELGPHGITANVLVAGWAAPAPAALADGIPVGRLAGPGDLASACAFLLSDAAAYVNGTTLAVDGGYAVTKGAGRSPLLESRA